MSKPSYEAPEKPVKNTPSKVKSPEKAKAERQQKESLFVRLFVDKEEFPETPKKPWWKI